KVPDIFVAYPDPTFTHAVEFRHKSWFNPEVYRLLEKNNVAMAWSLNQYLETPAQSTANFGYLRMVGERDITEFKGIQKERSSEMKAWADKLREKIGSLDSSSVFLN